jgi:predicted Zn-dependent protease with MMP-like domain
MGDVLRRGDAGSSALLGLTITASTAFGLLENGMPAAQAAWLILVELPIAFAVGWLITGKLASDAARIHAQNAAAAERREALARRMDERPAVGVSDDDFVAMVEAELDALPPWLSRAIEERNVGIMVDDQPPEDPRTLGLFRLRDGAAQIVLYQRTITRAARDRDGVRRQIHDTMLHELGHLFGMSERDLDHYTIGNNPLPDAQPVRPADSGYGFGGSSAPNRGPA